MKNLVQPIIKIITTVDDMNNITTKTEIVDFLFTHLGRFRDEKNEIRLALDYTLSADTSKGGYVFLLMNEISSNVKETIGICLVNKTGMGGYIPENILVYIAVDEKFRGNGLGTKLMKATLDHCNGDVALHVEYDNPAKRLYERIGFTSKYAEMRYIRTPPLPNSGNNSLGI